MKKCVYLLSLSLLLISCYHKSSSKVEVNGRNAYFKQLFSDPVSGEIPLNFENQNRDFLQSQLLKFKSTSIGKLNDNYEWRYAGPNNIGGHTNAIVVDSRNPNIVLAGAETGGIWRSDNKGESWTFETANNYSLNVTSIVQHTVKKDTWFYSAGVLFKSVDNGLNWTQVHGEINGDVIDNVKVHPNGDVYVFSGLFIHRSRNFGESFEKVTSGISHETWQIGSSGKVYTIKKEGGGTGGGQIIKGLFVSDKTGRDFKKMMDLPDKFIDLTYSRMRMAANSEKIIWLAGEANKKTFMLRIDVSRGVFVDKSDFIIPIKTQDNYCFILEIHPSNPNVFVLGGVDLYRVVDGLASKMSIEKNMVTGVFPDHHVDQQSFCWGGANGNFVWSGHDGGLSYCENFIQDNSKIKWINKNNKYITTQFYKVAIPPGANDDRCVGGTQDNSCPFMRHSSVNFITPKMIGGDGATCHFGKKYIYQSAQEGELVSFSYDKNGSPDLEAQPGTVNGVPYGVKHAHFVTQFVVDSQEDYMIFMSKEGFWRRTNLTQKNIEWTRLTQLDFNLLTTLALSNKDNMLYYAGMDKDGNTKVFKFKNAGVNNGNSEDITPANLPNGVNVSGIGISPVDKDEFLVCASNAGAGVLLHSSDGGKKYQSVLGNLAGSADYVVPSTISVLISNCNKKNRYWVGTSAGLYVTENLDGNKTRWQLIASEYIGLAKIMDLKSRTSDGLIAIATYGRGS